MIYIKRAINGFLSTAVISLIVLLLIELISTGLGNPIVPMTPEFVSHFSSQTLAFEVDILLYGFYGAAFAGFTFVYDTEKIGFVVQNIIYAVITSCVWLPIVLFTWQLYKYPNALISTIIGFLATYVIMIIVSFNKVKKEIAEINGLLINE